MSFELLIFNDTHLLTTYVENILAIGGSKFSNQKNFLIPRNVEKFIKLDDNLIGILPLIKTLHK